MDFVAVASGSGLRCGLCGGHKLIWASRWALSISLSLDCVTGLCGGLELERAPAPRTGVAHMIDDLRWVLRWIAMGCGGFNCGGLWWDCDGWFVGFFMVVCGGFTVERLHLQWFLIFFFFSFYVAPNIGKYFSDYFSKCNQTQENFP